ncbi:MAG: alpha-(1-_3)-arabinofuranosyltransferase family protein [Ilumatobacteraceae bacterium]
MTDSQGSWTQRPLVRTATFLALLAYLPALTAAPGRMPADSKLYLYLDPGRFFADAASTFDGRQFAGWVPHQHIAYLWPSTPWFWMFDTLGVPDWVAHRLWIGTILLAAGLGVRWCARLLGLGAVAAFSAAIVYQLSLYVLPYISRTSVMLLPWAGVGWIVAFTIRASRRHTWGDPAAVALVVLTVGAVNATALAMIVPAPTLWLVHTAWQRSITARQAIVLVGRVAVLSVGVSLWWIAMLVIQSRYGTDVLPFSESLADVSFTATSPEVWRALGYWLFYIRDPFAATTTESVRYLSSSASIVVSYLIPLGAVVAITWGSWAHRRYASLLIGVGLVLAVGVHPITDRSPLMRLIAGDDGGGIALALRSSTRALPVTMLGIALALAMVVEALADRRVAAVGWPLHWPVAGVIAAIAIANLPSLWTGAFVDPALARDQDPPSAWLAAADALDATGLDGRVLQLPGEEFGAYRWGYTVDQPLPGLTEKALITRDLLPLGSPGAMDLLYALDDRAQDGVIEAGSIAPVARLLGVDTVWLTNDIAFDRFGTARPEVVRDVVLDAPGLGDPTGFGEPFVNRPDVPVTDARSLGDPRVGAPLVPVELVPVEEPGRIVRAAARTLVVSGSGDGLVDMAAAGLLEPGSVAVRYSADGAAGDAAGAGASPDGSLGLVVTDSNRDRARQWRSSQDTTGYTEPGGAQQDVLRSVSSDTRLAVFDNADSDTETVARQRGAVTARATSYGQPFAYLPEHRAYAAIDGDPDTAWIVGDHADPIGEVIRLEYTGTAATATLHQVAAPGDRRIARVSIVENLDDSMSTRTVELDRRSWSAEGQPVPLQVTVDSAVEIVIDAVTGGEPFTPSIVAGVGFSEIDLGLGPTVEVVRPPHDALAAIDGQTPLGLVFTRLRTDPMDRWRDDPETGLVREFDLPVARTFAAQFDVRVDARAGDAELAELFGWPAVASSRLPGAPRHAGLAAIDGDPSTTWITDFDGAAGATLTIADVSEPISSFTVRQPVTGFSRVVALGLRVGSEERVVTLIPGADGSSSVAVEPPLPAGDLEITLLPDGDGPAMTVDRRFGDRFTLPAAISEITMAGLPTVEPIGTASLSLPCTPLIDVDGRSVSAAVEVVGDGWLDGEAVSATTCASDVTLGAGTHLVTPSAQAVAEPLLVDRVVLDGGIRTALTAAAAPTAPTARMTDTGRFDRTIEIDGCPNGCWLVFGTGFNTAWEAEGADGAMAAPVMLDGGFNGWWVAPADGTTIVVRWTAQGRLTIALVLSILTALLAVALIAVDRPKIDRPKIDRPKIVRTASTPVWRGPGMLTTSRVIGQGLVWAALAGLLISPVWMIWGAIGGLMAAVVRGARVAELTALASLLVVVALVVMRERDLAPVPDGGWPNVFEALHGLGVFAVVGVLVGGLFADDAVDPPVPSSSDATLEVADDHRVDA